MSIVYLEVKSIVFNGAYYQVGGHRISLNSPILKGTITLTYLTELL